MNPTACSKAGKLAFVDKGCPAKVHLVEHGTLLTLQHRDSVDTLAPSDLFHCIAGSALLSMLYTQPLMSSVTQLGTFTAGTT